MALVEIRNVRARYGDAEVLKGVSLAINPSEFIAVLGPSGCGKTTLLRAIAGFVEYDGSILIDENPCDRVPPHKRNIGIVFQDYALFPHKTVGENIAFGLKLRRTSADGLKSKVQDLLRMLKLDGLGDRYPSALSGGQRQRVALARAIAIDPKLLLLDEPLSALDRKLREDMQVELRQIQQRVGITTLFVTHDQEEALALADRIVVMDQGRIRQIGGPAEIYDQPADSFVANFIGRSNFFSGQCVRRDGDIYHCELGGRATVRIVAGGADLNGRISFLVRPERLGLLRAGEDPGRMNALSGTIEHVTYLGAHRQIRIALELGSSVDAIIGDHQNWSIGEQVTVTWSPDDVRAFAENGQRT